MSEAVATPAAAPVAAPAAAPEAPKPPAPTPKPARPALHEIVANVKAQVAKPAEAAPVAAEAPKPADAKPAETDEQKAERVKLEDRAKLIRWEAKLKEERRAFDAERQAWAKEREAFGTELELGKTLRAGSVFDAVKKAADASNLPYEKVVTEILSGFKQAGTPEEMVGKVAERLDKMEQAAREREEQAKAQEVEQKVATLKRQFLDFAASDDFKAIKLHASRGDAQRAWVADSFAQIAQKHFNATGEQLPWPEVARQLDGHLRETYRGALAILRELEPTVFSTPATGDAAQATAPGQPAIPDSDAAKERGEPARQPKTLTSKLAATQRSPAKSTRHRNDDERLAFAIAEAKRLRAARA